MSYGERGPPKGYSNPRDPVINAEEVKPECQRCRSRDHWTFECPSKTVVKPKEKKLSRTEMLKRGIKRKLVVAMPPQSEREAFQAELKERAALLERELEAEREAEQEKQQQETEVEKHQREVACGDRTDKRARSINERESDEEPQRERNRCEAGAEERHSDDNADSKYDRL